MAPVWALGIDQSERFAGAVLLNPEGKVALERVHDHGYGKGTAYLRTRIVVWRPQFYTLMRDVADLAIEHDWSGPTVGDRECVRCGMDPREWLGERCTVEGQLTVAMEDVPSRVLNPKPAMTLLGCAINHLDEQYGINPRLPSPGRWQKDLGFVAGDLGRKKWAAQTALLLGYDVTAPDHWTNRVGNAAWRRKNREDLCDAFLIAMWASGWRVETPIMETGSARPAPGSQPGA